MRYRDTGNVHKDFHLATDTTIRYVLDTYGDDFLSELFARTAQRVYRDIYESLVVGDYEPFLEHLEYYYRREEGIYAVSRVEGGFDFSVTQCPAVRHVIERNGEVDDTFYLQFEMLAKGFCEATPFIIDFRRVGEFGYLYTLRPISSR